MKVLTPADVKIRLDQKDKKILSILTSNFRLPISQIAKLVGLSRQSVEYRIDQFKKNQLIVGSRAVINLQKLGYQTYHFFVQSKNPREEELFIKECENSDFINAIITYTGHWPLEISVVAKDPKDFSEKLDKIILDKSINIDNILIILETLKSKILPDEHLSSLKINSKTEDKEDYNLDLKDYQIIELLSNEADMKIIDIANSTKLSTDVVSYRIKKLYASNNIIRFRPIINYSALNLTIHTILLKTTRNNLYRKKFEMYVKNNNKIIWFAKTLGQWDYMIFIISSKPEELHEFIQEAKNQFSEFISQYETLYAYKEHKYSYYSKTIIPEKYLESKTKK